MMPVTEIINGIECVFPESKEKSFNDFCKAVDEAIVRYAHLIASNRANGSVNSNILPFEKESQ